MDARPKSPIRQAFRPGCESLERLALLSTLTPTVRAGGSTQVALSTSPELSVPTSVGNGDAHPSGVAVVPKGFPVTGVARPGAFLVSNTENNGVPRTGTTVVQISTNPSPTSQVFFQGQGAVGVGVTGAVGVLPKGLAVVGNFPKTATSPNQLGQAMLSVVDPNGNGVSQIQAPGGPLALTFHEQGKLAQMFVSNALTGTITRIDMKVYANKLMIINKFQIASSYAHLDASAASSSTEGPTGLAYDAARDVLYVASPGDNMVYRVGEASKTRTDRGRGQSLTTDTSRLHGPAGIALAPNGTLLVTNNDTANVDPAQPSELVQFSTAGQYLGEQSISGELGAAGGVAIRANSRHELTVAVANDATNSLDLYRGTD